MDTGAATFTKFLVGLAGVLSPIPGIQIYERAVYSGAYDPIRCALFLEQRVTSTFGNPCAPLDLASLAQPDPWAFYGPTWVICIALILWGLYDKREAIKEFLGMS